MGAFSVPTGQTGRSRALLIAELGEEDQHIHSPFSARLRTFILGGTDPGPGPCLLGRAGLRRARSRT